jgi:uncharacterized protein YccT (UPF0319 family)
MVETKEFKQWLKVENSRALGLPSVEDLVEEAMNPKNIKLEVKADNGEWVKTTEDKLSKE